MGPGYELEVLCARTLWGRIGKLKEATKFLYQAPDTSNLHETKIVSAVGRIYKIHQQNRYDVRFVLLGFQLVRVIFSHA
jgi:hypothetical protein